jgi:hypothetical protein
MFKIGEFLMSYVPVDSATAKKLDPSQPDLARSQYLERFDNAFNGKAQLLLGQCKAWMILAESRIQSSICHEISGQTANGKIISRIMFLFLFTFSLHMGLPFSPLMTLFPLCVCCRWYRQCSSCSRRVWNYSVKRIISCQES